MQWEDGCEVENADCNFCKEGDKTENRGSCMNKKLKQEITNLKNIFFLQRGKVSDKSVNKM